MFKDFIDVNTDNLVGQFLKVKKLNTIHYTPIHYNIIIPTPI